MSEEQSHGERRQGEVYVDGTLKGNDRDTPVAYDRLQSAARETLSSEAFAYVAGGAGSERTMRNNRRAFDRWRLVPRMLRDVDDRELTTRLFGQTLPVPFLLAPIGVQSIVHDEAELATARAAATEEIPLVQSMAASRRLEDVASALGETPGWFQLYWSRDREVTRSAIDRAERAGYGAIVVTVDTPLLGWRERDVREGYLPFLDGEGLANYTTDPAFRDRLDAPPEEDEEAAIREFLDVFTDASLDWEDLSWLSAQTDLPLIVKGIVAPEDARLAVEHGADGVVVSNHGGRQVDGAVASLAVLPEIAEAVGSVPVLFDSGIRTGADALKALALGADAVLLGRPYAYGLAVGGASGVRDVAANFRADLDITMGLVGCSRPADVDRQVVRRTARPPAETR
ncbi:alpha-hydroxy-acid oxidizing protein [Halomicrobium salinisoli]|uniref:alpha-hydroxy-acid oxidizing protein n=1 Tax=Halomicrobium salinisoli TaxID=2878391 RepID=UPI001CF0C403|nr:alpha-hydroxy-acid oxidizing protein [Halomicrobium salinisoli]